MRRLTSTAALLVLLAVGCDGGSPPPETYPVKGVVLGVDGSPVTGGMVEFRQTEEPFLGATGPVGPDGTFELHAIFEEQRLGGVPAGTYRVTVLPDFSGSAEGQHLVEPATLPEPVTVSPGAANDFEIDLRDAKN